MVVTLGVSVTDRFLGLVGGSHAEVSSPVSGVATVMESPMSVWLGGGSGAGEKLAVITGSGWKECGTRKTAEGCEV